MYYRKEYNDFLNTRILVHAITLAADPSNKEKVDFLNNLLLEQKNLLYPEKVKEIEKEYKEGMKNWGYIFEKNIEFRLVDKNIEMLENNQSFKDFLNDYLELK